MKELVEDAGQEKALKHFADATTAEKLKAAEEAEKRAYSVEEAKVRAEGKFTELEVQLGGTKLKLAKVQSLNIALGEDLVDLKVALDVCEGKWYNEGFVDAENSAELVMRQTHRLGFDEGWLAAL